MQSSYINLLSLSPCTKEIPYLGTGIAREDGQLNHGFKNLVAYPELINAIPELSSDRAMKSLVHSLNTRASRFFTTGCFSRTIAEKFGYRHHGYLEFSWNCQVCIRDAINYFSLFFHFEQFLHNHQFDQKVKFQWSIQQTKFTDVNLNGFCCAIFIDTDYCTSSDIAYDTWKVSLTVLESFLNSVPGQSAQTIYNSQLI
jgi:hypothetical protein